MTLTDLQRQQFEDSTTDSSDRAALFANCTLEHGNQRSTWDAGCTFDHPNPEYR